MNYEQHIPFYIHKFEDYPWKKHESTHYIFHVEENSLAEQDIEAIKAKQETAYAKIIEKLKFTVHAVYNEKDKVIGEHEDTHLLTLELGLPISLFQEGLAEFMVGKSMFGKSHDAVIKSGLERGLVVNLENLMSQQGWLDTPDDEAEFYYSVAGAFVAHLYSGLELDVFKKLYSAMDRKNIGEENVRLLESVTGLSLENLEASLLKR